MSEFGDAKRYCGVSSETVKMWYILAGIVNYIVISPILLTFLAVVFSVSSVGKAFGLRRFYVNFLLRIFEVRHRPRDRNLFVVAAQYASRVYCTPMHDYNHMSNVQCPVDSTQLN